MIRSFWLTMAVLCGLAAFSAIPVFGAEPSAGSQTVDNALYTAKLDRAGQLASFVVKPFGDELIEGKYVAGEPPQTFRGGLFVGPPGRVSEAAKLATTASTTGGLVLSDPSGTFLPKGLEIEQSQRFNEKSYAFDVKVVLHNRTNQTIPLTTQLGDVAVWLGPVMPGTPQVYPEVVTFRAPDSIESLSLKPEVQYTPTGIKWIGVREQYYAAIIEERSGRGNYLWSHITFKNEQGKDVQGTIIGFKYQYADLRSRESVPLSFRVYLGPKLEANLKEAGYGAVFNNWEGLTGSIGKLMFLTLKFLFFLTGSYGIAILLLTLLVKVVLHPLNLKQLRSMQKLQLLQPKMADLKKRFPDSREFQMEVQKLYMEHNVNPLGGCLPILLQIPIFIALYSSLNGAIELKRVPFLWMPDLAKPDPIALLPMLFAGSIYLSSKMTTPTQQVDKTQQTVMQIMPIMMLMLMVNVPSGVMIYLAGQSVLSLFETKYNQKLMAAEDQANAEAKAKRKKGKKGSDAQ